MQTQAQLSMSSAFELTYSARRLCAYPFVSMKTSYQCDDVRETAVYVLYSKFRW